MSILFRVLLWDAVAVVVVGICVCVPFLPDLFLPSADIGVCEHFFLFYWEMITQVGGTKRLNSLLLLSQRDSLQILSLIPPSLLTLVFLSLHSFLRSDPRLKHNEHFAG